MAQTQIIFELSNEFKKSIEAVAVLNNVSISAWIRLVLTKAVEKEAKKAKGASQPKVPRQSKQDIQNALIESAKIKQITGEPLTGDEEKALHTLAKRALGMT